MVAMTLVLLISCKEEETSAWLHFSQEACLVERPGASASVTFTSSEVVRVSVSETPEGWTAIADFEGRKVTVTAPTTFDYSTDEDGEVVLIGYDAEGRIVSDELYVAVGRNVDLTAERSNCYIANYANTYYSFDARYKGESNESLEIASVDLAWVSEQYLVQYLSLDEGRVSFFVGAGKKGQFIEGNALISAYNAAGEVVWNWHIWITEYNPAEENISFADRGTFMTRNLGAGGRQNATEKEILATYGLYYQWGRPTPFVGPYYFDCASAVDHEMFSIGGRHVYIDYLETDATSGTVEFALTHPTTFVLGNEASGYDWLQRPDATLWGDRKTLYDPCPKGWKVPAGDAFVGLEIADDRTAEQSTLRRAYGWNLTDGVTAAFFMGGGRRSALQGELQNLNTNDNPQPWSGFYWTTATEDRSSLSMYFDLNTVDAAQSVMDPRAEYPRANGFQIRCVRIEE